MSLEVVFGDRRPRCYFCPDCVDSVKRQHAAVIMVLLSCVTCAHLLTKVQKCTTQELRHRSHAKLSVAIGRRHDRRLQQKKIMGEPVVLTVGLENRRDGPLVRMKASPMKTHELMSVTMIKDICLSLLYIIYEISCRDNETMYKAQGGPK